MHDYQDEIRLIRSCLSGDSIEWAKPTMRVASNQSGNELLQRSESMHQTVSHFVQECAKQGSDHKYASNSFGMEYALGAYALGAARLNREDFANEVAELPSAWIVAIVGAISMFFVHTRFGYSCGTAPNDTIFDLLKLGIESCDPQVAEICSVTFKQLSAPPRIFPAM